MSMKKLLLGLILLSSVNFVGASEPAIPAIRGCASPSFACPSNGECGISEYDGNTVFCNSGDCC